MAGRIYKLTPKGIGAKRRPSYSGLRVRDDRILGYITQAGLTMGEIEEKYHKDHYFFGTRKNIRELVQRVKSLINKGYII